MENQNKNKLTLEEVINLFPVLEELIKHANKRVRTIIPQKITDFGWTSGEYEKIKLSLNCEIVNIKDMDDGTLDAKLGPEYRLFRGDPDLDNSDYVINETCFIRLKNGCIRRFGGDEIYYIDECNHTMFRDQAKRLELIHTLKSGEWVAKIREEKETHYSFSGPSPTNIEKSIRLYKIKNQNVL